MRLICLLGRHGSGKSTIGSCLAERGYRHISVGLLRRLAGANQFPADVPAILMLAMRRERPGQPMSAGTAEKLVRHAVQCGDVVLDGFPACESHLALLPPEATFALVWTPATLRRERLDLRTAHTQRIWTPGRPSERESSLPHLIRVLRDQRRRCIFVPNRSDPTSAANHLVDRLSIS